MSSKFPMCMRLASLSQWMNLKKGGGAGYKMTQQPPKHPSLPSLLSQQCWGPMQRSQRLFLNSLGALKCPWLKSLSPGLLSSALRWPHPHQQHRDSPHWIQKALISITALQGTCCRVSAALPSAPWPYTQSSHDSYLLLHPQPPLSVPSVSHAHDADAKCQSTCASKTCSSEQMKPIPDFNEHTHSNIYFTLLRFFLLSRLTLKETPFSSTCYLICALIDIRVYMNH